MEDNQNKKLDHAELKRFIFVSRAISIRSKVGGYQHCNLLLGAACVVHELPTHIVKRSEPEQTSICDF